MIPSRLFKFYAIDFNWLHDFFAGRSIKFSSRTEFNDPFDSKPAFQIDVSALAKRQPPNSIPQPRTPAKKLIENQRMKQFSRIQRESIGKNVEDMLDGFGILCITEVWDNTLMWSHYAKDHTGICIEFDTQSEMFCTAFPVIYSAERPVIHRPHDNEETMRDKCLLHKASCWSYEREWRVIQPRLSDAQIAHMKQFARSEAQIRHIEKSLGHSLYSFNPSIIRSITFGMRTSSENMLRVWQAAIDANLQLDFFVTQPVNAKYSLQRKRYRPSKAT